MGKSIDEQKIELMRNMRLELEGSGTPENVIQDILKRMISQTTFIEE